MQQLLSFWSTLDNKRRLIVVLATVAMFAAVLGLSRMASRPTMALLYAGLESGQAGLVISALEQRGAPFEIRGDAIWVASDQRDQLRMSLAGEGLPANSSAGYELLDQLSGFGTTSQMFDAAYLRAREGELARTIATSPFVRAARVHLAVPTAQPFRRDMKTSASVTVTSAMGGLNAQNAQAIRHLVASAIPGLLPADVSVIDTVSGLIPAFDTTPGAVSDNRTTELKRSVERLLAARVGPGRALVELSLDVETDREAITERRFDPQGRVAISTETESRSNSSSGTPPGVTVASNLPEGDQASGEGNRSQGAESRERVNYEVSETAREVVRTPGGIRRLSVAVLVDGIHAEDGSWTPRSDAEIADLGALVSSAVGLDANRGDVITIRSMQFDLLPADGTASGPGFLSRLDPMALIQLAVVAILILAIALFVIRPLITSSRRTRASDEPLALPPALPPALDSPIADADIVSPSFPSREATDGDGDPLGRLRQLIAERQTETVEILRNWMDEREESR